MASFGAILLHLDHEYRRWQAWDHSFHWVQVNPTPATLRSRILIAAFVLDAACVLAAPFVAGLMPKAADAAEAANHFLLFSDGHCYELSKLDIDHWRIEGEADVAACQTMYGD